jgi:hypothetical protein
MTRARTTLCAALAFTLWGCAAGAPAEPAQPEPGAETPLTACEEPRHPMCTREYKPVCAEVDTGVRCVKAPCPSTERKTHPNACSACADPKVLGHRPGACEAS